MLEGVRDVLLNRGEPYRSGHRGGEQCARVESVDLNTFGTAREIVVLVRDLYRPECLFGWRKPAVDPMPDPMEPELWVTVVWANFEEDLMAVGYGLPEVCTPNTVTWF